MSANPQDSAVALEVERTAFEAWMPKFWSRESFKDDDGDTIYCDDLVQGAWIGFQAGRASQSDGTSGVPEGCTPADARMLRAANHGLAAENDRLREALQFYADGNHFVQHDTNAWDTVSGEPANFYEDESNTATVEDGSVAKMALADASAPNQSQGENHVG